MHVTLVRIIRLNVKPLFESGVVRATPDAMLLIAQARARPEVLLVRHMTGDWGEASAGMKEANRLSLEQLGEIVSKYRINRESEVATTEEGTEEALYVVTSADRTATTFLTNQEWINHG